MLQVWRYRLGTLRTPHWGRRRGVALHEVCNMTDEQIRDLFHDMAARLESLHREILAIREAVLPDLGPIIAMHQGKPASAEKGNKP